MGISMLILMASFLESRMKGRVGISDADKEVIYHNMREPIIEVAAVEIGHPNEQQQQAEQLLALHKKIH